MTFPETIAWLRGAFPPKRKVVVRRVRMNFHGTTSLADSGTITVSIRSEDEPSVQKHTLIHEWAHVGEYSKKNGDDAHGESWEHRYGEIYRAWEKFA